VSAGPGAPAPPHAGARVLIDARAAVRPELGGVERWARELARRLPALRPDRYEVARPPAAFAYRAGHAWEQAVLPFRARSCALLLGPANLALVAFARNVVVIHDAAVLRDRTGTRPPTRAGTARCCRDRAPRQADHHRVRVLGA
jgi:hypothetical protein